MISSQEWNPDLHLFTGCNKRGTRRERVDGSVGGPDAPVAQVAIPRRIGSVVLPARERLASGWQGPAARTRIRRGRGPLALSRGTRCLLPFQYPPHGRYRRACFFSPRKVCQSLRGGGSALPP